MLQFFLFITILLVFVASIDLTSERRKEIFTGKIVLPHRMDQPVVDPAIIAYMGESWTKPTLPDNMRGYVADIYPQLNSTFTLSAWILTGKNNSFVFSAAQGDGDQFSLSINSAGILQYEECTMQRQIKCDRGKSSVVVADNLWRHISFVKNRTVGRLYVDGNVVGKFGKLNLSSIFSNHFCVGVDCADVNNEETYFQGALDLRVVYGRSLQAAEIQYLSTLKPTLLRPKNIDKGYADFIVNMHRRLSTKYLNTSPLRHLLSVQRKSFPADAVILEFGVWMGSSINAIAKALPYNNNIFGFDSFEGLPGDWVYPFLKKSFDMQGNLPSVFPNVNLIPGWFTDTLPTFKASVLQRRQISLLHIDCDIYSSASYVLRELRENIREGTFIVFDELINYEGFHEHEMKVLYEIVNEWDLDFEIIGAECAGACQPVAIKIV